jgi:biopolymer transport protein ExbB/TolQ
MTDKPDSPDDKPPGASGEFEDRWDDPLKRADEEHSIPEREAARADEERALSAAAAERAEEERLLAVAAAARAEEERLASERAAAELAAAQKSEEERAAAMAAEIQRAQERRAAEQREDDERAAAARDAAEAKRLAEKRAAEEHAARMRAEDLAEDAKRAEAQRAADRRAREQRAAEQRLAEQREAERRAAEDNERLAEDKREAAVGGGPKGGGGLALGEAAAGAGALGLIGAAAIFIVAAVFFVAESFFLATLLISFALLVYVAGAELGKLLWSSLAVFFSSKHLIKNAVYISDTVVALRKQLYMRRDDAGNIKVGPIEPGTKIKLPDNPLVRELQVVLKRKKGKEYGEYVAHQYYVDCRELYDHFHAHLDFVANVMPLFGLIGTVIGLIGMFDRLGSNTSIENLSPQLAISLQCTLWGAIFASMYMTIASRFDQRIRALEYDFDILLHSFDVLVENGADVELQA